MALQANDLFHGRYRLIEERGRGSFGEVWLARDEELDLEVAVKIYIALDDRGIEEFKEEYRTAYALNHPNLLHAYHFDVCESHPYLVMPYCPNSAVSLVGDADEEAIWHFIRDVSSGLDFLHSKDIIHRDIKPDNILQDEEGVFKITDFGISMRMRSTLRRNSGRHRSDTETSGTIGYMAPELFSAEPDAVKATDIWALGVTVYEMLKGVLPFMGQGGVMLLHGAEVPSLGGAYSDELNEVVRACLSRDTWCRPTAEELSEYARAHLLGKRAPMPWLSRSEGDYALGASGGGASGGGAGAGGARDAAAGAVVGGAVAGGGRGGRGGGDDGSRATQRRVSGGGNNAGASGGGGASGQGSPYASGEHKRGGGRYVLWTLLVLLIVGLLVGGLWFMKSGGFGSSEKERLLAEQIEELLKKQVQDSIRKDSIENARREAERIAQEEAEQKDREEAARKADPFANDMVYVQGGTFTMGATSEQGSDAYDWEKPTHRVTLSDFYISKYEVTQKQWREIMGTNPSNFKGDNLPVENVSWNDVKKFIEELNERTGKNYRLPTEAEWEYAARGGNKSRGYKYSGSNNLEEVAWYVDNASKTHPVGYKKANELGLYDMSGNVWEWCSDWYGTYGSGSQTNPKGPLSGSGRVLRGGGWSGNAGYCRVSIRFNLNPDYGGYGNGFRLARSL